MKTSYKNYFTVIVVLAVALALIVGIGDLLAGRIRTVKRFTMATESPTQAATQTPSPEIAAQENFGTVLQTSPLQSSGPMRVTAINWETIQFDNCGQKSKYENMSWWNGLGNAIETTNLPYYSDAYINTHINSTLKSASENAVLNPDKIQYTQETYCNDTRIPYKDALVCGDLRNKKLSIALFNDGRNGEGCLAKDGTVFIAVFPGEYGGGGNYILRYSIRDDILEAAQKTNENAAGSSVWFSPPSEFGRRMGNIIKMYGRDGDAGCMRRTEFDYDFVANTIRMTKMCTICEGAEKEVCNMY